MEHESKHIHTHRGFKIARVFNKEGAQLFFRATRKDQKDITVEGGDIDSFELIQKAIDVVVEIDRIKGLWHNYHLLFQINKFIVLNMIKNRTSSYHDTLADCIADVRINLLRLNEAKSSEFDDETWRGVTYETTERWNFKVDTIKDKHTRKYACVVIYRLSSGRYELTCYIN